MLISDLLKPYFDCFWLLCSSLVTLKGSVCSDCSPAGHFLNVHIITKCFLIINGSAVSEAVYHAD